MDNNIKKNLLRKLLSYVIAVIIIVLINKINISTGLMHRIKENIVIFHLGYYEIVGLVCIIIGIFLLVRIINNGKKIETDYRVININDKEYICEKANFEKIGIFGISFSLFFVIFGIWEMLNALNKDTDIFIPTYMNDMIFGCVGMVVSMMIWYIGYKMNNCISGRLTDLQPITGYCIAIKKIDNRKKAKYKNIYSYCVGKTFYSHIEEIRCKEKNVPKINTEKTLFYCSKRKVVISKEEFKRARKIKVIACLLLVISLYYTINMFCKIL